MSAVNWLVILEFWYAKYVNEGHISNDYIGGNCEDIELASSRASLRSSLNSRVNRLTHWHLPTPGMCESCLLTAIDTSHQRNLLSIRTVIYTYLISVTSRELSFYSYICTRKHFNRMHTAHLLTISCSIQGGVCLGGSVWGDVCIWSHGGVFPGEGCLTGGCLPLVPWGCLPRGCLPRGCLPRGMSASGPMGECVPPPPPWTDRPL